MSATPEATRRVVHAFSEACKAEGYDPADIEPLHIAINIMLGLVLIRNEEAGAGLDDLTAIFGKWKH